MAFLDVPFKHIYEYVIVYRQNFGQRGRGRGRGRGGRGGRGGNAGRSNMTREQLDAQLDAYKVRQMLYTFLVFKNINCQEYALCS